MIIAPQRYVLELVLEAPHLTALDAAKKIIDGKLKLIETSAAHSLNLPPGVRLLRSELRREGV